MVSVENRSNSKMAVLAAGSAGLAHNTFQGVQEEMTNLRPTSHGRIHSFQLTQWVLRVGL